MDILSYYLQQQENPNWVKKFQSTSDDNSWKIYPFTNTNFRTIDSFLRQMDSMKDVNWIDRKNWAKTDWAWQEKDKQRINNLRKAKFITSKTETIFEITPAWFTCLSISNQSQTKNITIKDWLNKDEQRLLLYLLLLNYWEEKRKETINCSRRCFNELKKILSDSEIFNELEYLIINKCKNKASLFSTDIFRYITFANDDRFLEVYKNSSISEREKLHNYVINKASEQTDCIAHKYISSWAFSTSMFKNEATVLYLTNKILLENPKTFDDFVGYVIKIYGNIYTISPQRILKFIQWNKMIYEEIFNSIKWLLW